MWQCVLHFKRELCVCGYVWGFRLRMDVLHSEEIEETSQTPPLGLMVFSPSLRFGKEVERTLAIPPLVVRSVGLAGVKLDLRGNLAAQHGGGLLPIRLPALSPLLPSYFLWSIL